MPDLFSETPLAKSPLAYRMRPKSLDEFCGQEHLLGPGRFLARLTASENLPSLILWGPPGSGKTTLARLIAQNRNFHFVPLSAVTAGIKEVRDVIAEALESLNLYGKKTVLFLDEIHRFNKAQQDALLPHVEKGTVILIGATTENPSFEVISPLLSRAKVVVLEPLRNEDLGKILDRALADGERGLGNLEIAISPEAREFLLKSCEGDARRLLNTLEIAADMAVWKQEAEKIPPTPLWKRGARGDFSSIQPPASIGIADIEVAIQRKSLIYDKSGEQHYNVISAFIKSMRGSDPSAAVYYLARLLEAGEDPLFVARRMVIFASEDVGNADPQAVQVAISCMQAFDFVGLPEGWIPLAQCATYLASAPKSNASYMAYKCAKGDVEKFGALDVPLHLRNAPTNLMKDLNYGKGYKYAHDDPEHIVSQEHLPEKLESMKYYQPTDIGYEKQIREWLGKVEKKKGT